MKGLRPVIVDLSGATSLLHVTPLLPTRTLPLPSHRSACTPPYIPPPPSLWCGVDLVHDRPAEAQGAAGRHLVRHLAVHTGVS